MSLSDRSAEDAEAADDHIAGAPADPDTADPNTADRETADPDTADPDTAAVDEEAADQVDDGQPAETAEPADEPAEPVDEGETLFYEPGGSWWIVAIGPVLIAITLALEISGGGRIHWEVLTIFGVVLIGFAVLQVVAARRHVSVHLTERTLRQGTQSVPLETIATVFPANTGTEYQDWESAPALGELHAVPRRRKGIGVKLADGRLAQAWARDVEGLRSELTDAHLAVRLGLPPRGDGAHRG